MATTTARFPHALGVVDDLAGQVDKIVVYVNGGVPKEHDERHNDKVLYLVGPDLADNGKFAPHVPAGWHLTVDDDLHYPPDYVEQTIAGAERHPRAVVSWHGCLVDPPVRSYYRNKIGFACLGDVQKDQRIHIPGTGAMCYDADRYRFDADEMPIPYMADIWIGAMCQDRKIPVVVLAHEAGWITHRDIDHSQTIYSQFTGNDRVQTWLINSRLWRVHV